MNDVFKKILLVDDEVAVHELFEHLFAGDDCEIVYARNGNEALECLAANEFAVLVVDYLMPGMNGADLLRKAKTAAPRSIKIMLTGHCEIDVAYEMFREGALDYFVTKPFDNAKLKKSILGAMKYYCACNARAEDGMAGMTTEK